MVSGKFDLSTLPNQGETITNSGLSGVSGDSDSDNHGSTGSGDGNGGGPDAGSGATDFEVHTNAAVSTAWWQKGSYFVN